MSLWLLPDDQYLPFEPIEMVAPQENPPPKIRRYRDPYNGMRIRVGLVRDEDYVRRDAPFVQGPEAAYELFAPILMDEAQEVMLVACVDNRLRLLGIAEVVRGGANQVYVTPADLFRPVLAAGATSFFLAHNHPTGDPQPSNDDLELTKRIDAAGVLLGIPLLDHIIVGAHGSFTSLSTLGYV